MKKITKIALIVALALGSLTASAQGTQASNQGFRWGVKAGVDYYTMSQAQNASVTGLVAGVTADYFFNESVGLSAELIYSGQGADLDVVKFNTHYLNIPILFNFNFVRVNGLRIKAGIQPGVYVFGKATFNYPPDVNHSGLPDKGMLVYNDMNPIDVSIPVGVSYMLPMGLEFEARYNFGLTNVFKETSGALVANQGFVFSIGYKF